MKHKSKLKKKEIKENLIEEKTKLKRQNGITLIALVITIIVLLILAAVSIATLTGENGILTRANEAKTETEEAKEDELRRLTALEAATNIENTEHTETITQTGTDGTEETKTVTVTIPAGFAVSQVEGENTIEDGLVIIDSKGNEFVWVPVDNYSEFTRRAGYFDGNLQSITNYSEADSTGNNTNSEVTESETTKKEAQEMYKSVEKNGGFYIGRYEAGKDDNGNVIIQKGKTVYNNVTWSRNGQMNEESTEIAEGVDGTKDGTIELARNFDTENSYTTVTSTLCYGVQWDAALSWINPDYTGFVKNSTGKGNYNEDENTNPWKGNIAQTGVSEEYKIKNIYDMAGNAWEWTMEAYHNNCRVFRGGSCYNLGLNFPASMRNENNSYPYYNNFDIGFRITLYL